MNKRQIFTLILSLFFIHGVSSEAHAQHKGISFQAVLKKSDGSYPTAGGITITAQILDPVSHCVLREEEHAQKNISNGYLNLVLGDSAASTPGARNPYPVLSLSQVLDNKTKRTNLKCVDEANNIVGTGQSYTPSNLDRRILRLRFNLQGEEIAADFNMRSVGFAVNSEMLNSKTDQDFINVNSDKKVTQENLESVFEQFTKLSAILSKFNGDGTGAGINISGAAATANNVTGVVAVANGGTGATTSEGARTNLGLGSVATIDLPSEDATSSYLRGDGQWVQVTPGGTSQVTASSPLSVSGTTTANISLAEASSSTSGYLTKEDWTKFNGKQEAGSFVTALIGDVTSSGYDAGSVTTTIADDAITAGKIANGAVGSLSKIVSAPTSAGTNRLLATDPTTGTTIKDFSCSVLAPFLKWTGDATGFGCQALSLSSSDITGFDTAVDARINSQKGGVNGLASLNGDSRVPTSQLGSGTADGTKVLLGNGTWGDAPVSSPWVKSGTDIYYSAGKVGIGTETPEGGPLDVAWTGAPGLEMRTNWEGQGMRLNSYYDASRLGEPRVTFARSRGTKASPLAAQSGDVLGTLMFAGYDGVALQRKVAYIRSFPDDVISPTSSAGFLTFSTTPSGSVDPSEKMRITSLGNVGIGTTDPKAMLDVAGHIRSSSGVLNLNFFNSAPANGANFHALRGRGTVDSIAPVLEGDALTGIYGGGYTGADTASGWVGVVRISAAENFSPGSTGTKIELMTTPIGSSTRSIRMTIGSEGNIGIGLAPKANTKLAVSGAIVSVPNVPSGTTTAVDLSLSNTHILKTIGGSAITLNNMTHGGSYVLVVEDPTARTYTFNGCTSIKFKPANTNTTVNTSTIYNVLALDDGASGLKCYISWSTGFQ